jgi:hypothetical protein
MKKNTKKIDVNFYFDTHKVKNHEKRKWAESLLNILLDEILNSKKKFPEILLTRGNTSENASIYHFKKSEHKRIIKSGADLSAMFFCHPLQELYNLLFILKPDKKNAPKLLKKKRFQKAWTRIREVYGPENTTSKKRKTNNNTPTEQTYENFYSNFELYLNRVIKEEKIRTNTKNTKDLPFDEASIQHRKEEAFSRIVTNKLKLTMPYYIKKISFHTGVLEIKCSLSIDSNISDTARAIKAVFYQIIRTNKKDIIDIYQTKHNSEIMKNLNYVESANDILGPGYDYFVPAQGTLDIEERKKLINIREQLKRDILAA